MTVHRASNMYFWHSVFAYRSYCLLWKHSALWLLNFVLKYSVFYTVLCLDLTKFVKKGNYNLRRNILIAFHLYGLEQVMSPKVAQWHLSFITALLLHARIESCDVSVISVVAVLIKGRSRVHAREDVGQRGVSDYLPYFLGPKRTPRPGGGSGRRAGRYDDSNRYFLGVEK